MNVNHCFLSSILTYEVRDVLFAAPSMTTTLDNLTLMRLQYGCDRSRAITPSRRSSVLKKAGSLKDR